MKFTKEPFALRTDLLLGATDFHRNLCVRLALGEAPQKLLFARAQDKNTLGCQFVLRIAPFVPLQMRVNAHYIQPMAKSRYASRCDSETVRATIPYPSSLI